MAALTPERAPRIRPSATAHPPLDGATGAGTHLPGDVDVSQAYPDVQSPVVVHCEPQAPELAHA